MHANSSQNLGRCRYSTHILRPNRGTYCVHNLTSSSSCSLPRLRVQQSPPALLHYSSLCTGYSYHASGNLLWPVVPLPYYQLLVPYAIHNTPGFPANHSRFRPSAAPPPLAASLGTT
ncbi:uncharacterized protein BDCG_17110 [Blastomyces dermatitidis ER-3]|uniref:Uncharacterized protein n=2 Tax=Blastomyces TaxID=229219 RepID=A0A179UWV1_BLAGS|nr:uncharacterized protein BDBG_07653 [Blastomyces gilchristii SLH14081]XP_045281223.1 uncharacterized protein BDCG_17110 [Blastomyces dermatitidis ER-3]OAT01496.1 hypothetical protein BDCG_17110 [Blastomyces dermatitidis ER-3]OAT12293.1 hypothetical protein BDBG_07653 [Blastomyces gilchristii SLH14081]